LLVSEEPVEFRLGQVNGHARGLHYNLTEGWLELRSEVAADFPLVRQSADSQKRGLGPLNTVNHTEGLAHLTASRLRFDKSKGEITLGGPVVVTERGGRLTAAEGEARLDSGHRVTAA